MPVRLFWMVAVLAVLPLHAAQRFVSRAEGVRVDVLVTDGSRRVHGLTAADFEVRDNGVVQRVSQIDLERVPLNVVCVFDTSGSVAGARLQELVAAARAVLDQLRQTDRVAVLSFATHVSLALPLTDDHDRARSALAALRAVGETSLRDAVFAGLALRDTDPARTLLLVFSDGDDTSSWLLPAQVFDAAKRTDVVAYAVQAPLIQLVPVAPTRDPRQPDLPLRYPMTQTQQQISIPLGRHGKFLESLAEVTGGRLTQVEADKDLTATFTAILGEFRDRYVLSYSPDGVSASGWHELAVTVKGKSVKVTARRGYFAQ